MQTELIDSSEKMDVLLSRLQGCELIAVDTEFFRETTYYPKIALVQIANDSLVACIDPLAFDAKDALRKILLDPGVTKIFHSCSQDMEVLFYYLGEMPLTIYDTQIANALLYENHQVGYASLVEREFGIKLDKSQTRTNWLKRPLTEKQLAYAGEDVIYLYQLHDVLEERLTAAGRTSWFVEENDRLTKHFNNFEVDTSNLWRRVKGTNRLPRDRLAIVQAIAEWREQLAQRNDVTRRRLLADELVIELANPEIDDVAALDAAIPSRYRFDEQDRLDLLASIKEASRSTADDWPDNSFSILDNHQKGLLKNMQRIVSDRADELGISSAVLCPRKELEKLIRSYRAAELDAGDSSLTVTPALRKHHLFSDDKTWRYSQIGEKLMKTAEAEMECDK